MNRYSNDQLVKKSGYLNHLLGLLNKGMFYQLKFLCLSEELFWQRMWPKRRVSDEKREGCTAIKKSSF